MNLDDFFAPAAPTLAVLGDLMLDEWIAGTANRISPEAPVPVVRFESRKTAPGGAANVVMNGLSLGARARAGGVVGDDEAGRDLAGELSGAGADIAAIVRDASRPTTLKTRIVAQRQQMVRVDRESDAPFDAEIIARLQARFHALLDGAGALCLSDYAKGLAQCGVFQGAVAAARERKIPVTGGPKPENLECFAGADFLSLNQKEASEGAGFKIDNTLAIERAGHELLVRAGAKCLAITRGGAGVSVFRAGEKVVHVPAYEVEVFDVAGAGDTFLSAATLALARGADCIEASRFGNLAAASSVRHVGVVAVTRADMERVLA
ncbi:D-beta-D-heptose 7-phosphate kinase / D-beta-D-heptose 1-phosphate adenosyltransferase [Abditibacterium utsteinense]|uniref:D-beta-D-heptose 7-phosphate kinase / D-beta-D-heptose 1-phosphate adenosyltransferase n=1 Tax=Abditibacterium utsteinense TaxID=1960156 RepID=A0A2S8SXB1_9BACT|nr:PfkB family carbohydrate kinase [Abditibacterium utsteinense]PQV65389.1 D-beta-D-heptose 7-phosphate kinase / D-beta-D-heptose 1-phosphate adenosyltransferase [Abditibacterium utsteinense]